LPQLAHYYDYLGEGFMKLRSLKFRITVVLATMIVLMVVFVLTYTYNSRLTVSNEHAEQYMAEMTTRFGVMVEALIDAPAELVYVVADTIGTMARYTDVDRATFWDMFDDIVASSKSVSGLGFMFAPNAFDGADAEYIGTPYQMHPDGRFAGYSVHSNGRARRLPNMPGDEAEYGESYYTEPMRTGKLALSEPYLDNIDGNTYEMFTVSAPIRCPGTGDLLGVVLADMFLQHLYDVFDSQEIYDTGYIVLTDSQGTVLYSPVREHKMQNKRAVGLDYAATQHSISIDYVTSVITGAEGLAVTVPVKFDQLDDLFFITAFGAYDEIHADTQRAYRIIVSLGVFLIVFIPMVIFLYLRYMLKPLDLLADASTKISAGNFQFKLPKNNGDEIGALSVNFNNMAATIKQLVEDIEHVAERHEHGIVDAVLDTARYQGMYAEAADETNKMIEHNESVKSEAFECIANIVNGDFNAEVRQFPGQEARINDMIENLRANIKNVAKEINEIVMQTFAGNLKYKVDDTRFIGEWNVLIKSLNAILQVINRPFASVMVVMSAMEGGDFTKRVNGEFKGEFLNMKNMINKTVDTISSYIDEINVILASMAVGELAHNIERPYVGQFASIRDSINLIFKGLRNTMRDIAQTSDQVLLGAENVSRNSNDLSQGAVEQAASLQELQAAANEIDDQSKKNAENAQEAAKLAETSKHNAEIGNNEMTKLLQAMDGITTASDKISNIIRTIQDIAFQTNLLALNASIEAAHAGVHGSGFAVVAEEVRNLATKSDKAAKETGALIQESIDAVSEGTSRANETAGSLSKIVGNVTDVSNVIEKIYEASTKQTEAIMNISAGLGLINNVVQSNSTLSEESASAAQELSSQSEILKEKIAFFKTDK